LRINSDGFFRYCEADILVEYDKINELMYLFDWKSMKEYINYFYVENMDRNRVDYIYINDCSAGYGVYILKFQQWMINNNRYFKIIDIKEVL
jgi:hypothetical protein